MTVSAGVTSWGRRGSECGRTGVRPGWIGSPWSRWRTTAWTACCVSCVVTSNRVGIVPRQPGVWRSRNHEAVSGRWGFPRCETGWPRRRPRSCWNRFSRRTFCRARMGFGRSGRPRRRWSGFAPVSSRAHAFVVEFDIANFFGEIDHDRLLTEVGRRVSDRQVLKLLRYVAAGGVLVDGVVQRTVAGTPQGGVISPLLANIYLHVLDTELARPRAWVSWCATPMTVWCCAAARHRPSTALAAVGEILASLGLRLHPDKTKVVDLREGRRAWIFWAVISGRACRGGCGSRSGSCATTCTAGPARRPWPGCGPRSVTAPAATGSGTDIRDVIAELNPILRGWGNYFRTGNAATKFRQIDRYVVWRLCPLDGQEAGPQPACRTSRSVDRGVVQRARPAPTSWHHPLPEGRVTMSRRSSVSRVRENRTHGLKGGWGNGSARGHRAPDYQWRCATSRQMTFLGRLSYWMIRCAEVSSLPL